MALRFSVATRAAHCAAWQHVSQQAPGDFDTDDARPGVALGNLQAYRRQQCGKDRLQNSLRHAVPDRLAKLRRRHDVLPNRGRAKTLRPQELVQGRAPVAIRDPVAAVRPAAGRHAWELISHDVQAAAIDVNCARNLVGIKPQPLDLLQGGNELLSGVSAPWARRHRPPCSVQDGFQRHPLPRLRKFEGASADVHPLPDDVQALPVLWEAQDYLRRVGRV